MTRVVERGYQIEQKRNTLGYLVSGARSLSITSPCLSILPEASGQPVFPTGPCSPLQNSISSKPNSSSIPSSQTRIPLFISSSISKLDRLPGSIQKHGTGMSLSPPKTSQPPFRASRNWLSFVNPLRGARSLGTRRVLPYRMFARPFGKITLITM